MSELNSKCWYKDVCRNKKCVGCIRYAEMNYLMQHCGLPEAKQRPIDLYPKTDNDLKMFQHLAGIKDNIVEFVNSGDNLYIASKYSGNGKTSWAINLLFKYFDQVWAGNGFRVRGLFIHVPTFLSEMKDFKNPVPAEHKREIEECDLVIWDDIASAELSNFDYGNLLTFVDKRILAEHSNIYTSNIPDAGNLECVVGTRLSSRIMNCSQIVVFDGKDQR